MNPTVDFETIEENAKDAPLSNIKWYGKETETDQEMMHDTGKGEPIVIRLFEFKFPPTLKTLPTKEEILTPEYLKHLNISLWADELRMVLEPRVSITKEGCKIFAPCKARTGANFVDNPKLLQEWIKQ